MSLLMVALGVSTALTLAAVALTADDGPDGFSGT
jgi:hypothetical protein